MGREIGEHTVRDDDIGSIIVVVATDAPLIPTQLKRVARRVSLGLGRDGSFSGDGSGDIFIAFSTANPGAAEPKGVHQLTMLPNQRLNPIFLATVQATEEAVINAMVAAKTMKGINDVEVIGLPHDRLREVLKKYNRLVEVGAGRVGRAPSPAAFELDLVLTQILQLTVHCITAVHNVKVKGGGRGRPPHTRASVNCVAWGRGSQVGL